jgi:hypothetical protein
MLPDIDQTPRISSWLMPRQRFIGLSCEGLFWNYLFTFGRSLGVVADRDVRHAMTAMEAMWADWRIQIPAMSKFDAHSIKFDAPRGTTPYACWSQHEAVVVGFRLCEEKASTASTAAQNHLLRERPFANRDLVRQIHQLLVSACGSLESDDDRVLIILD